MELDIFNVFFVMDGNLYVFSIVWKNCFLNFIVGRIYGLCILCKGLNYDFIECFISKCWFLMMFIFFSRC